MDQRVQIKESEKINEYLDVARELEKWNMWLTFISIVIGAVGMVQKGLEESKIRGKIKTIQTTDSRNMCMYVNIHVTIWTIIPIYEVHTISFQTFFVWALLLIVHAWNSSPFRSNLLRLKCACCTIPTSRRPHWSPLLWVCQWPSSQPLSSPQLSHNDSLWA